MRNLITSAAAHTRLAAAQQWLAARAKGRAVVVAATQEAASETVRTAALRAGASFGWQRLTLRRLAAVVAADALAARGLSPLSPLGVEAVCARVVHQLGSEGALGRLQPVWNLPGLARAVSRTVQELRMAGARPPGDLRRLLEAYEAELLRARLADTAEVFRVALEAPSHPVLALPALLIDLPLSGGVEERLLSRFTGDVLATAPPSDAAALARALGVAPEPVAEPLDTSLQRVQQRLFGGDSGPFPPLGEDVQLLSAPGESRECMEIARLVRREAQRGTPFDQMAVLLRAPGQYRPLLEEAFARAGVPAFFATGTLKPDPAGRAFLALLACAVEGLSARSFAEYLSLGEVPHAIGGAPPEAPPAGDRWVPPDAELTAPAAFSPDAAETADAQEALNPLEDPDSPLEAGTHGEPADLDAPVVAGSLRAPWRWEKLIVDAAVIGGRHRWQKRLAALARALENERLAFADDEARLARAARGLRDLSALRDFALPLLDELAALPREATWGAWIDPLTALASRALRRPQRVQSLLAELAPMSPVGPVTLPEVRLVLARRLTELAEPPPRRRYGAVFVGPVAAARGLSFEVVFVPALAERLFPQKVVEDPLLRDRERAELPGLETGEERVADERLALQLAVGAARRKTVLSWPRIELAQARARVPSFYALEVLRAAEGKLPAFGELARRAEEAAGARAGWPAPHNPADAVDEAEHDLALLGGAFNLPEDEARGIAAYLKSVNPHLVRALRARARKWLRRWTPADGLVQLSPEALAALQSQQPSARAYSPTALQNFSTCPYRFVLQAIHRLAPREVPEAIDEIDPLERGSLIHKVQYRLLRDCAGDAAAASEGLDAVVDEVAREWEERLAPAIDRVWKDCVAGVKVDLREWLRRLGEERRWIPWRFELAFGLQEVDERDSHSTPDPVKLEGVQLRGSIDLVERAADGSLRATDYKTGKAWAKEGTVIGGGATLQPALYALVLEKLFPGARVEGGRLYYCTYAGDYTSVEVPLATAARASVAALVETVSGAVKDGFLPAAPREARDCERCDYQPVCGPSEWQRTRRKPIDALVKLTALRELP